MGKPIIELKGITKTFGTGDGAVTALKDVSLTIDEGEIFGVIGLSGAGKSTLVRCINLLEKPTAGTVIVNGKELTKLSEKELRQERRSIGMIFCIIGEETCPELIRCMTIAFGSFRISSGIVYPFCWAIPTGSLFSS